MEYIYVVAVVNCGVIHGIWAFASGSIADDLYLKLQATHRGDINTDVVYECLKVDNARYVKDGESVA